VLRVASAFPDPPFEVEGDPPTGFDVDLVEALADELGRPYHLQHFEGTDFDGIFAGLGHHYDAVVSGATVTEFRETLARWCRPYLRSGQSLVVDAERHPDVRTTDDLGGLTLGVQEGNTSEPVARQLHADGKLGAVKRYAYDDILVALHDVETGVIAGFMKLEPVMRWLTADRPTLRVVQTGITTEHIAIAVATGDAALAHELEGAQRALRERGTLAGLAKRWLGDSDPTATEVLG
jgi:ABC-type amino acid transport substrate-binding protein